MNSRQAVAFVKRHGVVLMAARGPLPNLAEVVAGGPIRGSWWGHPKGRAIYAAAQAVSESPDVLVCKLVGGKVTFVHRRLWPALVKLSAKFGKAALARVREEHTKSGAHRLRRVPFPRWVPREVVKAAAAMSVDRALKALGPSLAT